MSFKITIEKAGRIIDCAADQTILVAAITAGIDYPYACATGNCATCISRLQEGEVDLLPHGDGALSRKQKESGLTLACRARPRSDVTIVWL
jgi:CDP-4-dehydro-6-deoxyglucose reductase/ferredoxin-NAD(P)+ reductase (naphthalene dioxygenase ferredoxin-specific)